MVALGDVEDLSANAAVMLKISVLAAWAELQIAATRQAYLVAVVQPYRWLLGPFWIGALRDYAQLRTDPEMGAGAAMDLNNGLGRDVLLPVSGTFDDRSAGSHRSTTSNSYRSCCTLQPLRSRRPTYSPSAPWTVRHSPRPPSRPTSP